MMFGLPLLDKVRPVILKLALYDRKSGIYNQPGKIFPVRKTDSGYILTKTPVLKTGLTKISFGIQAIDQISGSRNEDGIYSAKLFLDDAFIAGFALDSISYDETGYMNAHIDFKYKFNGGPFFQNLFRLPGDRGGVYIPPNADGAIHLSDTLIHAVRIEVEDANQNISELRFLLQYSEGAAHTIPFLPHTQLFVPNQNNVLQKPGFEVVLPPGSVYDTVRSYYYKNSTITGGAVSASHQLNDPSIPIHDDFVVRIRPEMAVGIEAQKLVIIQRAHRQRNTAKKAIWRGDWMEASFGEFGVFQAFVDDDPPRINELGKGDTINLSPASRIVFQPTDNFGIKNFRAELDGQWLRFTNDKGRSHIYIFDERVSYGVHHLKVEVEDLVGNITTKTWWFKKYPYKAPVKKAVRKTTKKKTVKKKKK
jgi:hypothetical protein